MNYSYTFFVLSTAVFLCLGCHPTQMEVGPIIIKEELTGNGSKKWKLKAKSVNGQLKETNPCEMDDIEIFAADKSYLKQVNGVQCYENESNFEGYWSMHDDRLLVTASNNIYYDLKEYKIIEITENLLVLELEGMNEKITISYSPI